MRRMVWALAIGLLGCGAGGESDSIGKAALYGSPGPASSRGSAPSPRPSTGAKPDDVSATLCGAPVGQGSTLFSTPKGQSIVYRVGDRAITGGNNDDDSPYDIDPVSEYYIWDTNTGVRIATGRGALFGLAGNLVVTGSPGHIELHDVGDGSLVRTIDYSMPGPRPAWGFQTQGGVSTDGSYLWIGNEGGFLAWSTSGEVFASRTGDYSFYSGYARVKALPNEIRIFHELTSKVEFIEPGEDSTFGPPISNNPDGQQIFRGWTDDGENLVFAQGPNGTTGSGVVPWRYVVFSKLGASVGATQAWYQSGNPSRDDQVGVHGDYLWIAHTASGSDSTYIHIWKLSSGNLVYETSYPHQPAVSAVGDGIVISGKDYFDTLSLSGTDFTVQHLGSLPPVGNRGAISSDAPGRWCALLDATLGECYDGTVQPPQHAFLGCGTASFAGAPDGDRLAVKFATGQVAVFDTATSTLFSTFDAPGTADYWNIGISPDGGFIGLDAGTYAAQSPWTNVLAIFTATGQLAANLGDGPWYDFQISNAAHRIAGSSSGVRLSTDTKGVQKVADLSGTAYFSADGLEAVHLAPDGNHFAITKPELSPDAMTTIYDDQGGVVATLPGQIVWFAGNDLIVMQYYVNINGSSKYDHTAVYDLEGNQVASNTMPYDILRGPVSWRVDDTRFITNEQLIDFRTGAVLATFPGSSYTVAVAGKKRVSYSSSASEYLLTDL